MEPMINSSRFIFKPSVAFKLIVAVLLCAIEMFIVMALISSYVPYQADPALADIFFHYRKGYVPERELLLYGAGIVMCGVFFLSAILIFHKRFNEALFIKALKHFIWVHMGVVVIELGIVCKLIMDPSVQLLWFVLYGVLILSVLIKIFWSEIKQCFG